MDLFSFDVAAGHHVDRFGSDFTLSPLMNPNDTARTVCMHLPPGGIVGEHTTTSIQLFCVIDGEGWVSGDDGRRHPIERFQAARWSLGERHAAGTATGLTAVVLEGTFGVAAEPIS